MEMISTSAVAKMLGVSTSTVRNMVRENRFVHAYKMSRRKFTFLRDDVVAWMATR